ncbi:MAG: MerR family transcriptional regulator [Clostridia bacterium]|nr:MerR family transcriptional regulator [Clostridia bacterium]
MKIKEICRQTGLTDRTVRYYIEENLIAPFYTENYLGRKSFDFSQEDLEKLKNIATLRAFGFSVEEIKELSLGECDGVRIVETVKKRAGESLDESRRRLSALSALDLSDGADLSTLAENLSRHSPELENEGEKRDFRKRFLSMLGSVALFLAVWLPIISAIAVFFLKFSALEAPIVRSVFVVLTLICFLPSMLAVLIFGKLKGSKKTLRAILTVLCVFCLPLGIFFSSRSITVCDHRYVTYSTSVEATCQGEGEQVMRCEECGRFERQRVEKLPHTPTVIEGIPPTCTETGLSDGSYCSFCKTTLSEQTVIAAKGHSYEPRLIEQSCGVDGCILYECACGDSYKTDVVRATNMHDFQRNDSGVGYFCGKCGLEVIAHGNVDGSLTGGNDRVKFYITGPETEFPIPRTLVIYGSGDMPDFQRDWHPSWTCSYIYQVTTVIIESEITSIGNCAFSEIEGCDYYNGVKKFIIRSKKIRIERSDPRVSGIKCDITYDY